MDNVSKKASQPLWPIKVDVLGLPGSEHVPQRISVEVNGHTHVGNLCDHIARNSGVRIDWSSYALWWPAKNTWLLNGSFTLDNWEISAADILEYVPKLYTVQLMLPDLQVFTFQLDFTKRVFEVVKDICRKLYVRRPEELSLYRPLRQEEKEKKAEGGQTAGSNGVSHNHSTVTRFNTHPYPFSAKTIEEAIKENGIVNLEKTPLPMPSEQHLSYLPCGKKMSEKTRLTSGWLSSALSLMQQEIRSGDVLLLRFKYCTHIDLNAKKDPTRINLLYQQIRLSILNDENELTVEEATVLAGIMYQVHSQANVPQLSEMGAGDLDDTGGLIDDSAIEDELNNLAAELGSSNLNSNSPDNSKQANLTREPLLQNIVKVSRKKDSRLSKIGNPRLFVCTLQRFALTVFDRSAEETGLTKEKVVNQLNVRGCEVAQIGEGSKFKLRLNVDTGSGMEEFHLRVDDLNTYAKWYAALQLASRGHTMADSSFEEQLKATREMLQYRAGAGDAHDSSSPGGTPKKNGVSSSSRHGSQHGADAGVQVELFLSPKFIKKFKKEAGAQVIKGSGQVSGMGYLDSKKQLIQRWNDVKLAGTQFFNCSVKRDKTREKGLIGVCSDKLIQLDPKGQDIVQTYHYSSMMTWTVNWHKNELSIVMEGMQLYLETTDSKTLEVLHEYLGGYQIMGSRSVEQLDVDEEMFYKLTYGRKSEEEKIEELQKRDNQAAAGLITHSVPNF